MSTRKHGTRARYVFGPSGQDRSKGCRCTPCTEANARYARITNKQKNQGKTLMVDARPARAHVRGLMEQGMGRRRIAEAAGLSQSTLTHLLYGKQGRPVTSLRPATAQALLKVQLSHADGITVDATGTRRRIQALHALGWPMAEIARRIGWKPSNLSYLLHQEQDVRRGTAEKVKALYDELKDTEPTGSTPRAQLYIDLAKRRAAERGYLPPVWWDEEWIEEWSWHPPVEKARRVRGGRALTPTLVVVEDATFLWKAGEHPERIAGRLGITYATVLTAFQRAGVTAPWLAAERQT